MQLEVVSWQDWISGDPARTARFVRTLGSALESTGFVTLVDPPVTPDELARAYAVAERLFALPEAEKRACERIDLGRQRGYTPFGLEHAKDQTTADLKEFWQIGADVRCFPAGLPEADVVLGGVFDELHRLGLGVLSAVGRYLGLDDDTFPAMTEGGDTVLRIIHYPPIPADSGDAVRAAAHEDINLLTVLPVSTASGLELLDHAGNWVSIETPPDAMIIDTGDMMQLLTGGRLKATTHRVVNPSDEALRKRSRYSLPLFVHPHGAARLTGPDATTPGPTAAEFLHERLVAIGVS